jgi:hypothetical protein
VSHEQVITKENICQCGLDVNVRNGGRGYTGICATDGYELYGMSLSEHAETELFW